MKFRKANSINNKEKKIVNKVLDTGSLSKFIADPNNALKALESTYPSMIGAKTDPGTAAIANRRPLR